MAAFTVEKTDSLVILKLTKSFTCEDCSFDEIILDFDKITGAKLIEIEKEMRKRGNNEIVIKALDSTYCGLVAAFASDIQFDILIQLPGRIFSALESRVGSFLTNTD